MSQVAANVQCRKGEIKGLGISENNSIKCRICHESVSFYEMRSHIVSYHCKPFTITMVDIAGSGSFPCSSPVNVINSEISDVSSRQVNQSNDIGTSYPVKEEYVDSKDEFIEKKGSCSCRIDIVKQEPTSPKKSVCDFDDNEEEISDIFETASYQVEQSNRHMKGNKTATSSKSNLNVTEQEQPLSKPAWSEIPIDIPDVDEVLVSSDGTVTFKCKLCLFISKHKKAAKKHTLNHFPPSFSCNMCERRCQQRQDIIRHVKLGHPDISVPSGRENGQKSVKCDRRKQIFSNQLTFKRHVEKKIFTKKNTRCNICGKNFFDQSSLRKHVKNKVCTKNNSRCGGTFSSANMLNHVKNEECSHAKTVLKTYTEEAGNGP